MKVNNSCYKNKYFPSTIIEWNKLDPNNRESPSYSIFKKRILELIRPFPNSICNISSFVSLNYLTKSRLGLSHLREHKFYHNLWDSLNPICDYDKNTETTKHFLFHYQNFTRERHSLLQSIKDIESNCLPFNKNSLTETLLYGNKKLTEHSTS